MGHIYNERIKGKLLAARFFVAEKIQGEFLGNSVRFPSVFQGLGFRHDQRFQRFQQPVYVNQLQKKKKEGPKVVGNIFRDVRRQR